MVAGEFAVLEKDYPLIVMAVDRYVFATIEDSATYTFTSENFNLHDLTWRFNGKEVVFDQVSPRLHFVTDALTTVLIYLQECSIKITPFSLSIRSELDDQETKKKYGLGSSAAVVTSVISAVLEKFLIEKPTRNLIFRLAAISHVRTQGSGSGADIAASTYGGVLHFTSFQASWLKNQYKKTTSLISLVEMEWPHLTIDRVQFPQNLNVCIGWTGKPASTVSLVKQISFLKRTNRSEYDSFLLDSRQAVNNILQGMETDDERLFFKGINQNRKALVNLGLQAKVPIETARLGLLSDAAEDLGGAGKLSGAGGGDCGLAFLPKNVTCFTLHKTWTKQGIKPLSLKVTHTGTMVVDSE